MDITTVGHQHHVCHVQQELMEQDQSVHVSNVLLEHIIQVQDNRIVPLVRQEHIPCREHSCVQTVLWEHMHQPLDHNHAYLAPLEHMHHTLEQ